MYPWETEPDRDAFVHRGFLCVLQRNPSSKTWCAYVCLPPDHPWHGLHYDEARLPYVEVHGGLTFAGYHTNLELGPEPWAIGFDTAHACDFAPGYPTLGTLDIDGSLTVERYKTIAFTRTETVRLADQVAAEWTRAFGSEPPPHYDSRRAKEGPKPPAPEPPAAHKAPTDRTDEELTAALRAARGQAPYRVSPKTVKQAQLTLGSLDKLGPRGLDLAGHSLGIERTPDETDAHFRARCIAAARIRAFLGVP